MFLIACSHDTLLQMLYLSTYISMYVLLVLSMTKDFMTTATGHTAQEFIILVAAVDAYR